MAKAIQLLSAIGIWLAFFFVGGKFLSWQFFLMMVALVVHGVAQYQEGLNKSA